MKKLLPILAVAAVLLLMAAPAFAADSPTCNHDGRTIASLHDCVLHAYDEGHITGRGVRDSLLAKLDVAQSAQDRGNIRAAVIMLRAFIREVNAQAGRRIDGEHALHLADHANNVIRDLRG
jgi:hypothetical protein